MNNLLYIGLNGYAGAGKDTVAKMLKVCLNNFNMSLDQCKEYYFSVYTNPTQSATYVQNDNDILSQENNNVLCIAYADQLKEICAKIFGIPRQRFYQNKSTAWICINDKFQYTEIKPEDDHIVTADEYYYSISSIGNDSVKYWMSLREILVYIGTYVLQQSINKEIFVNIVRNYVREEQFRNHNLKYVIITDNRFSHELNYIRENNGITITITRNSIKQLDNVAEHDLDDVEDYDYVINNSGTYDELFKTIWTLVHTDIEFQNKTIELYTRENINNYLRLITENDFERIYKLCAPKQTQQLYKSGGNITVINPIGGPIICINESIDGTKNNDITHEPIIPSKITMDESTNQFMIYESVEGRT